MPCHERLFPRFSSQGGTPPLVLWYHALHLHQTRRVDDRGEAKAVAAVVEDVDSNLVLKVDEEMGAGEGAGAARAARKMGVEDVVDVVGEVVDAEVVGEKMMSSSR